MFSRYLTTFVVVVTVLFTALPAVAITLPEILTAYTKAKGGAKALAAIQSTTMKGTVSMMGMNVEYTAYNKRQNLYRIESNVQGMQMIMAYDGKKGYAINPFAGSEPTELEGAQLHQIKMQASMDGLLIGANEKGNTLEYLGVDTVESKQVHKIKVTTKDAGAFEVALDAATFLESQITFNAVIQGSQQLVTMRLTDYRKVKGVPFAHSIVTAADGQNVMTITIKNVAVNSKINDSIFRIK